MVENSTLDSTFKSTYNGSMIQTVSITELKQDTAGVVRRVSAQKPILILQRSRVTAVLVDPKYFEKLEKALEDASDIRAIEERKNEPGVPLDEYFMKRFKTSKK